MEKQRLKSQTELTLTTILRQPLKNYLAAMMLVTYLYIATFFVFLIG